MTDLYDVAKRILLEIGAIKACDAHDDFTYRTVSLDEQSIYARATKKYKETCDRERDSVTSFHGAVKRVLDDTGFDDDCPFCKKSYDE